MNITVLYNKPTARFSANADHMAAEEDTEESAHEIVAALQSKGVQATLTPITETTIKKTVYSIKADLVFNLIEWTGVDAKYAMETYDYLNARHIKYTGATKENYRDTCDKLLTKTLCASHDLPTASWQAFVTGNEPVDTDLHYPLLVKVSLEHSSVGIVKDSIVYDPKSLVRIVKKRIRTFHQPVFAETFLTGREFQVTIIEQHGKPIVLKPAEIVYTKTTDVPLLTYSSRWDAEHSDYSNSNVIIPQLPKSLEKKLESISTRAFAVLGFRDYARFDIRCDTRGNPYILELNSNPGLGDDPEYGMTLSYRAAGMTFADFVWKIVQSAARRYHLSGVNT